MSSHSTQNNLLSCRKSTLYVLILHWIMLYFVRQWMVRIWWFEICCIKLLSLSVVYHFGLNADVQACPNSRAPSRHQWMDKLLAEPASAFYDNTTSNKQVIFQHIFSTFISCHHTVHNIIWLCWKSSLYVLISHWIMSYFDWQYQSIVETLCRSMRRT